ncbi:MAG: transposase [Bacteroidales bacterium]
MPFEAKLDENNRWVVLSKVIPWDKFAELYYKNFPSRRGAPTKDARMVLGVVIIKHMMKLDDIGVIEFIQENPCAHYFLGLKGFTQKPVFDPSLLVHIRKRIDLNVFESLTDELIRKGLKIEQAPAKESKDDDEDEPTPSGGTKNKGKLQLDATVADAQIKFPTDLDLLSDSRVKAEDLIDHLCKEMNITNKPRTYRKIARKEYLNVSKMKRKPDKVLRRGLRLQSKYFFVIQHVLAQQEAMFKEKSNSCEDRIVSIHQPHVRPIVRGKAKAKVEFGAKINVSLQEGYARIDRFEWDAYNEGDKIYLNRANRAWLKERNIRHTGEPLGRKPAKTVKSYYLRRKERREAAERNQIEGKYGQGKNGYDMNQIRAKMPSTLMSWIAAILFIMNKPDKIYLDNTNLIHSLNVSAVNGGNVRETFFANQCSLGHKVSASKQGDFMIDDRYIFEVGGKNQSFAQIKNIECSFIAMDDIESGFDNKIPLWLFGFMY